MNQLQVQPLINPSCLFNNMTEAERIVEALIYIEWNIQENMDINSIAEDIGYTGNYFKLLFLKITGFLVDDYIQKRRLSEIFKKIKENSDNMFNLVNEYHFSSFQDFTQSFFCHFKIYPYDLSATTSIDPRFLQKSIIPEIITKYQL